jgi:ubiquitin C-terminal hydrolase
LGEQDIEKVFRMMNNEDLEPQIRRRRVLPSGAVDIRPAPIKTKGQVITIQRGEFGLNNEWIYSMKESKGPSVPGKRGIVNLGNTCFVAATLQVLSHSEKLRNFLTGHPSVSHNDLDIEFRKIVDRMWSSTTDEGIINPRSFFEKLHAVDEEQFQIGVMGDSHEVLVKIMDSLADGLKPIGAKFSDRSVDMDSLVGINDITRIECTECSNISESTTPIYQMILNIPSIEGSEYVMPVIDIDFGVEKIQETSNKNKYVEFSMEEALAFMNGGKKDEDEESNSPPLAESVSLMDCFRSNSVENVFGDYDCEKCRPDRREAKEVHQVGHASEILTILLKRFEYGNPDKIATPVDIPTELDLQTVPGSRAVGKYKLVGIVNHHGKSLNTGHYTAQVLIGDEWFTGNDGSFTPSGDITESIRSSEAYVLLYEKQ